MKLKKYLLNVSIIISSSFVFSLYAQEAPPPITWGEIPRENLEMKTFPSDTNASAVILCDYGESKFNNDFNIVFNRHQRVKILSTKGYDWGTYSIVLYTVSNAEKIRDVKGTTYWLNEKGEVEKSELVEDDVFKEELSDRYTRCKFTLPNLKPGCVIEVNYKIVSDDPFYMKGWVFQRSEPVLWSEYRITHPKMIGYAIVPFGYEDFAVHENRFVNQRFSGAALRFVGDDFVECLQRRWAVQNAPAIREEPYITTVEDYRNRIDVQLSGYGINGRITEVLKDWKSLVEELIESEYFGDNIDDTGEVTDAAVRITKGCTSNDEKLNAIYNWISSSITCSERNTIYAHESVDDVLESKKGNCAEITFLLISMLKSIGIEAEPIITSTRSNGMIQKSYPIVSQFNHVFARVKIDSQYVFIDATNNLRPIELLPSEILNVTGLVIKEGEPEWVKITTSKASVYLSNVSIQLFEDGNIEGSIDDMYYDYGALNARVNLKDKNDKEIAKEFFDTDINGLTVDSLEVFNKEEIAFPVKLTAKINSPGYAMTNGDMIYINPQIVHRTEENPFKTKIRKYPIDYSYRRSFTTNVSIVIPDGYELKENINKKNLKATPNLASYIREVSVQGNKIEIQAKFDIKVTQIEPKYYERIRYFYTTFVAAQAEQIVLTKKKTIHVQSTETKQADITTTSKTSAKEKK